MQDDWVVSPVAAEVELARGALDAAILKEAAKGNDEYARECLAIRVGRRLGSEDVLDVLTTLLAPGWTEPALPAHRSARARQVPLALTAALCTDCCGRSKSTFSSTSGIRPLRTPHSIASSTTPIT
jgi:hypothetical protein